MIRFWFRTGLAAIFLTAATSACAETKLLLSTFFPTTHPIYAQVLVPWAKDVEAKTQGRVKVEFAASSLAPPPGQLDMVQRGIADISLQFAGVAPNRLQPELVTELPGPVGTSVQMSAALWATNERFFSKDAGRYRGLHLLALVAFPPQEFFCVKTCPSGIDAIRSSKIATTPGTVARQYGALTSGVVAGPAVRYFEVVSKGIVDSYAGVTAMDALSFNLAPSTTGILRARGVGSAGSFALVVNAGKWSAIEAADRTAIDALSGAAFAARMAALDTANAAALKKLTDSGVAVQEVDASFETALRKAWTFLDDEWKQEAGKRGFDAAAALTFYRQQVQAGDAAADAGKRK